MTSLLIIYFHGYLIPGTPTITSQYFPEKFLRKFGKETEKLVDVQINPEEVLLEAGAITPCRNGTDLCLASDFQKAWLHRIQAISDETIGEEQIAKALGVSTGRVSFEEYENGALVASLDEVVVGQWSMRVAAIADVAASSELTKRTSDWADFTPAEIARTLFSLRIFLENCPLCEGDIEIEQETVESCCSSYYVVTSTCQICA